MCFVSQFRHQWKGRRRGSIRSLKWASNGKSMEHCRCQRIINNCFAFPSIEFRLPRTGWALSVTSERESPYFNEISNCALFEPSLTLVGLEECESRDQTHEASLTQFVPHFLFSSINRCDECIFTRCKITRVHRAIQTRNFQFYCAQWTTCLSENDKIWGIIIHETHDFRFVNGRATTLYFVPFFDSEYFLSAFVFPCAHIRCCPMLSIWILWFGGFQRNKFRFDFNCDMRSKISFLRRQLIQIANKIEME